MEEQILYHVLLLKEGDNTGLLVHTASTYHKAQDWVKERGCRYFIKEKYYFKVTSAMLNSPYISFDSGRVVELLTMQGEEIKLFDVWLVNTENAFSGREDKLEDSGLTKEQADGHIHFGHADEPSPDRADYWNYVKVPHGFKPAQYQRK